MPMNWRSVFGNFFLPKNRFFFRGQIIGGLAFFNNYAATREKLEVVLRSFPLLKVFALQCDLFSMANFYVKDIKSGKYILDDPFLDFIKQPNPFEGKSDLLWSFMFNHMIGNGNIWATSKIVDNPFLRMYVLDNWKIEVPSDITGFDKLLESDKSVEEFLNKTITYNYNDGTTKLLKLGDIMSVKDLNVSDDWVGFQSRIDALYKIITNFEEALNSENINIRYAGKFMVAGKSDIDNINQLPLSNTEKQDIEQKTTGPEPVTAVKSMIDIKRFIDSIKDIGLTETERAQFSFIGNMYGVPEEVLKAFVEKGTTFENQEKARGGYVDYVLEPKGSKLCHKLNTYFGYTETGKEIIMSWDHLAFMQVFEKEKAEISDKKALTMERLLKLNVPLEEINRFLDTDFTEAMYVAQTRTNAGTTQTS